MIPQTDRFIAPAGHGRLIVVAATWLLAAATGLSLARAEEVGQAVDQGLENQGLEKGWAKLKKAPEKSLAKSPEKAAEQSTDRTTARDPAAAARKSPDPLAGTPKIKPEQTGQSAEQILARLSRPRTDSWADWIAPLEPLHYCGEPRALAPCVPPPPCHPSQPPVPYDLVGDRGEPTCGPIYGGPCAPRTGTHDDGPHPRLHRAYDRFFDCFYMWK